MKRFEEMNSASSDLVSIEVREPKLDEEELSKFDSPEKLRDYLFDEYMKQNLLDDFFESASEYFEEEEINTIQNALIEFGDSEILSLLSLPYELRGNMFERWADLVSEGKDISEVVSSAVNINSKHGFGVGYHTSPFDLRPDELNRWEIKGTEPDHRDYDVPMAYYSTQYRHIFKKKNPKFIYMIRTDPKYHKTDGNWHRAASLSVIGRVPFQKVASFVDGHANKKASSEEVA